MIYCVEDDADIRELELYTLSSMGFVASYKNSLLLGFQTSQTTQVRHLKEPKFTNP